VVFKDLSMSLAGAMTISRSGMDAVSKWSQVTSQNISNANTEGYTKKTALLNSYVRGAGQGVYVSEVRRETDTSLDILYRLETSKLSKSSTLFEGIDEYTKFIGQPSEERSLTAYLSNFESSLIDLGNAPRNEAVQRAFLEEAQRFAVNLNQQTEIIAKLSDQVEVEIQFEVAEFNELLLRLQTTNDKIFQQGNEIGVVLGQLEDLQANILDEMSQKMGIIWREDQSGRIDVFTSQGTPLLDVNTIEKISYNNATGQLSAGSLDITPGNSAVRSFSEGSLAGLYDLKDDVLPRFQLQLDETARTLIENFESTDTSRAPGDAGFFTDGSSTTAFNPINLLGLAGRISINDLVIPENGGSLHRVRDGVGAVTPGPASDITQIQAWIASLDAPNTYAGGTNIPTGVSVKTFVNNMVALQQSERSDALTDSKNYSVSAEAIYSTRSGLTGVNIDDELQDLIRIEQAYAANSQVLKSVSEMLDILMSSF
jgi:flagellar hook-associated protein 1 FlgK